MLIIILVKFNPVIVLQPIPSILVRNAAEKEGASHLFIREDEKDSVS